jgi:hypothetical protein
MTATTPPVQANGLYSRLELRNEGDIRLVRIVQCGDGNIFCELRKANLQERPQYVAISYTWGPSTNEEHMRGMSSDPSHPIICNDHQIMVTENLYGFLIRAAEDTGLASRYMWIDSICIDQTDLLERTNQVNMMAAIYHSAVNVVVWLGEEDEHTKRSFDLIRSLGRLCDDCLKQITPRGLGSDETLQMLSPSGDIDHWRSLARLFQRRYFTRVWIIQEITLATRRLAVCGRYTIDWGDVVKVSKFLTVTSWTRWICPGGMLAAVEAHQSNHAIPNLVEATRRTRDTNERKLMLYSLIRARRFEASDPRDKVYALLGIVRESIRGKSRYNPVYKERSMADTYTLAAIQLLEDSDDLLVLAHAEGDAFQTDPSLPSWVPDWSCTRVVGLGVTGYARYSACINIPRSLHIDETTRSLIVKGIKIDQIVSIAESKEDILKGRPFPRLLSMACALPEQYHTGPRTPEIFWRVLLTDTAGTPPVHPAPLGYGHAFSSWFRSKLDATRQHTAGPLLSKALEVLEIQPVASVDGSTSNGVGFSNENDVLEPTTNMIDAAEYEAMFSHSPHLRPFLTSQNYFGVGSESLLEGDSVWVIAGSRVPLILQEAGPDKFRVVGGAYVHGFMKGEGLRAGSFGDITLI